MKAIVNGNHSIVLNEDTIKDIVLWQEGDTVILRDLGKNIRAHIISTNHQTREYQIEINKKIYQVKLETALESKLATLPMMSKSAPTVNIIKSPMPGLVLKINKSAGDEVIAGETLLVLEAMKMENQIKSPVNGRIHTINVQEGAAVEKGSTLIVFDKV